MFLTTNPIYNIITLAARQTHPLVKQDRPMPQQSARLLHKKRQPGSITATPSVVVRTEKPACVGAKLAVVIREAAPSIVAETDSIIAGEADSTCIGTEGAFRPGAEAGASIAEAAPSFKYHGV
jgi:hypothetical protein